MKNYKITCILCLFLGTSPSIVDSQTHMNTGKFIFDADFMKGFARMPAVSRDAVLESKLEFTIHFRGIVSAVDEEQRYRKRLRGIVVNDPADRADLKMKYYVFFNSDDSRIDIEQGGKFAFTGKFMSFTPLNTRRDSYIFDIVFENGTAY